MSVIDSTDLLSETVWSFPTSIHFGTGSIRRLPEYCHKFAIKSPLIITDQGLMGTEVVSKIVALCQSSSLETGLYSGIQENPIGTDVDDGVHAFYAGNHDGIVAIGGGSAIDVGKVIALVARSKRPFWALGGEQFDWSGVSEQQRIPLIAVPTTAGTGAEVSKSSAIIHELTKTKKIVYHSYLLAPQVIADPELSSGLPPDLTAAAGISAFVHCFEAFSAPGFHPMADGIALEGISIIAEALPKAYDNGANIEARSKMMAAAIMGATAFQKSPGGIHALAQPLAALYNLPQGVTKAILLPYVMLANRAGIIDKMELMARVIGLQMTDFDNLLNWVIGFRQRLGIPHSLAEANWRGSYDVDEVGRQAAIDVSAAGNPLVFTAEQYATIFSNALEGRM